MFAAEALLPPFQSFALMQRLLCTPESSNHIMKIGETVKKRYKIQKLLGQGGMGKTYKALDLDTKRPVAVKQLHLARIQEWKTLEMFEREAKILQQLNHPRVPTYIDYFSLNTSQGKQFFLVQEYVHGKTLKQLTENGWRASEPEILDIFIDLVDILIALHRLRPPVIHRDINPKNIIISPNKHISPTINDVYLVDFGAVQDKIRTTLHGSTTIVGTFGYVPFEQFSGQGVPASDYYALGATLLYMLTHQHPSEFPTDDLKPQFEPFLHSSPIMANLLHGLLEPSVKKRITSLEQIREILDHNFIEPSETFIPPSKPVKTKIKKIIEETGHVFFYIPKQKIGVVITRSILHLSPHWLWVSEEMLGIGSNKSRRIPLTEIQPEDFTWYFNKGKHSKGKSVFGINYGGETLEIGVNLSKQEIEWLTREINEYSWTVKTKLPCSEHTHEMFIDITESSQEYQEKRAKPRGSKIKRTSKGRKQKQLRLEIPNAIHKEEMTDIAMTLTICLLFTIILTGVALFLISSSGVGWIIGGSLLLVSGVFWILGLGLFVMGMSRMFGKTILQLTSEWINLSHKCLGLGRTQHIPTAALQPNDIIRYFHKNKLVLGINFEEKTLKIGAGLSHEEIEWLIQEVTNYIAKFAKPLPKNPSEKIELEMK